MIYKTRVLAPTDENIGLCAEIIKEHDVVAMPTETVYGLAADAFCEEAVRKIFAAKNRPCDNPLIVHISNMDMLEGLVRFVPKTAKILMEKFWPGPLTIILPKSERIPSVTSGGLDTVGIRMPSHPLALKLIRACGCPLAAPSANLSGSPSPTKASHVYDDLNGRIRAILDGGSCEVGVESTVVSVNDSDVRVLRPGKVSVEELKEVCENVIIDKGVLSAVSNDVKASSPGMKYKHYAPKAQAYLVSGSEKAFESYVLKHNSNGVYAVVFDSDRISESINIVRYGDTPSEQAERLFDILRSLDKLGAETVYVRTPSKKGVGLAVYNRLIRACGFRVIEVGE